MKTFLSLAAALLAWGAAEAQCSFNPAITGNTLLCPLSVDTLKTESYDAYQWYSRPYSGGPAVPIPGATGQYLEVNADDTPFYVSVAATQGGCTAQSAEILVDGLAFLPVTVLSEGFRGIGPDGELLLCSGDTIRLIALQPYTINFTWYDETDPIAGAHDDTLLVSGPGRYWLTASPGDCPDFADALGVQITVAWDDSPGCAAAPAPEPAPELPVIVSPNPARTHVRVTLADHTPATVALLDQNGRLLRRESFSGTADLYVGDLPRGAYVLRFSSAAGMALRKLVLQAE